MKGDFSRMNWRFWTRPDLEDSCARIEPLLSLESDGMASPAEKTRIVAHLQTCDACRQAQMWMQATHLTLIQRPAVSAPPALRARIVQAMGQTAPTAARPAPRPLILRPAFAAACSLALVGAALHLLWPGQTPSVVAPLSPPVARVEPSPASPVKRAAPPTARVARRKPPGAVRPPRPLIADARPVAGDAVRPSVVVHPASPVPKRTVSAGQNPRVVLARNGENASAAPQSRKTTVPDPIRVAVQPPVSRTPPVEVSAPPVEIKSAAPTPAPEKPAVVASAPPPVASRPDINGALRSGLLVRQGEAQGVRTVHASMSSGGMSRTASYDPDRESRSGTLSAVNSDQVQLR